MPHPILMFIDRIQQIDLLIRLKATGTAEKLASKIGISRSMLYEYLSEMKTMGAPIDYDRYRQTYFYTSSVRYKHGFEVMGQIKMGNIKGGLKNILINPVTLDNHCSILRQQNQNWPMN